jgi:predicted DsbA family dithiol-disulfide isomerase
MGGMSTVDIDVWADVVYPWCYIGKRRLEQAIAESPHPTEVTVTYHAFERHPETPVGTGQNMLKMLASKYHTDIESIRDMCFPAATAGRPDGIDIEVDSQIYANSFDAHRLVALGLSQGGPALQAAVLERLFSAHFTEGKTIDDTETLQRLGGEAGLDGRRLASVLAGDEFADEVRADEEAAREIGITDVPFFMANQKVALSGAHTAEVLGQLITAAPDGDREAAGHPA